MTAAASRSPEPYEVPEGGLASFLTATVGDWSDEALNADNYYDIVKPTAEQLAQFGREEDDRIAHVATGETIIPMAVFEEDPALKEALFTRMREMGIDPERYIVGNELNSINPVTGQPEFFLKKIFKGIKKAVKGVVKVFKKIAPIVLSVVGGMFLGPVGAALGSGIGTLIQGGNLKDAFKSALISGVTAGVAQGIGQGFEAAGSAAKLAEEGGKALTFGEKLAAGVEGFGQSIGEGLGLVEGTSYLDQFSGASGILNPTGEARTVVEQGTPDFVASDVVADPVAAKTTAAKTAADAKTKALTAVGQEAPSAGLYGTPQYKAFVDAKTQAPSAGLYGTPEYKAFADAKAQTVTDAAGTAADAAGTVQDALQGKAGIVDSAGQLTAAGENLVTASLDKRGFFEAMADFIRNPSDLSSLKQAFIPDSLTASDIQDFIRKSGVQNAEQFTLQAGQNLADALTAAKINPGIMRSYLPAMGLLSGVGSVTGFFDQPPMDPLTDAYGGLTGQKLIDMYPSQYTLSAPGAYVAPSMAAADGGGIDTSKFPRRNGRISGPGTETSDDIPAMLSDGEFVMTAKAVRGAGNGSREAGMRNMYNMMSRFERNA